MSTQVRVVKYFSRVKFIISLIVWGIVFLLLYRTSGPFFKSIYSIQHFSNHYFDIEIKNDLPIYKEVDSKPTSWASLNEISKRAIWAIIVSEDGKFYDHLGYDVVEMQKVMILKYIKKRKKVRGASTITQQLIKNLYLTKEKSLSRKVKELYLASFIEEKTSKEKILEAYLNVIEFGKGIYGIQNASHYYFKKSAKDLTAKEGAFLAMLLPNPKKYAKSFHQKMLTPFAKSIIESILSKMEMAGFIGAEEREINLSRPLVFETKSIAKANESDTSIFQDESNLDEDVND